MRLFSSFFFQLGWQLSIFVGLLQGLALLFLATFMCVAVVVAIPPFLVTRLNVEKMLFDGALLPVVVQTTVRSPEGDVFVQTNWCLF